MYMRDVLLWLPVSQSISDGIAALVWRYLTGSPILLERGSVGRFL